VDLNSCANNYIFKKKLTIKN